ncbi:rhomboid family intramembrane serine protease [Candidatus Sumerlaeota bacterium]|nr:rhomboid family intramembrane serine protease [Candidatus Sumerlaeota bacterium]
MENESNSGAIAPQRRPRQPLLTLALLLSQTILFFSLASPDGLNQSLSGETALRWGALQGLLLGEGEGLRLITHMFIHQRFVFLLINLTGVLLFVLPLELRIGIARTFAVYFAGGLAGGMFASIQLPLDAVYCGATAPVWAAGALYALLHIQLLGGFGGFLRHPAFVVWLTYFALYFAFTLYDPDPSLQFYHGGLIAAFSVGMYFLSGGWLQAIDDGERRDEIRRFRNTMLIAVSILFTIGIWLSLLPNPLMDMRRVQYYLGRDQALQLIPLLEKHAKDPVTNARFYHLLASAFIDRGQIKPALTRYAAMQEALGEIDLEALRQDQKTSGTASIGFNLLSRQQHQMNPDAIQAQIRFTAAKQAYALLLADEDGAASQTLTQALKLGPASDPAMTREIVQLLGMLNCPQAAEKFAHDAIQRQPRERMYYEALLDLYLLPPTVNREKALTISMEIERQFGREQWPLYCEGRVYEAFCDYERALEFYAQAQDASATATASLASDDWADYWRHQGVCHMRMSRYEKARPLLELAYNRAYGGGAPADGALFFQHTLDYVICLQKLGEKELANNIADNFLNDYLRPCATPGGSWRSMNLLAWFLAETGLHSGEAVRTAENSVALFADDVNLDTLAWALYRNGEHERALQVQKQAMEKARYESPELLYHLGAIYEAQGELQLAAGAYEKALRAQFDFGAYRDCQEAQNRVSERQVE